jgi:ribosomal protein S4
MRVLGFVLTIIAGSAFAENGYDLKINLSLNGKHVASPRIIVKAGEKATITQRGYSQESFIEVVATENEAKNVPGILMKFSVGYIQKNGERTIISQPQILTNENSLSTMTVGKIGEEQLSLIVQAERKSF